MKLSVFYEFCQPDMLKIVSEQLPSIIIDKPIKPLSSTVKPNKIFRTNAKLFYSNENKKEVTDVVAVLEQIGFTVVNWNPYTIYKNEITVWAPENDIVSYRKCECGHNDIMVTAEEKPTTIKVNAKRYSNDRVILEVPDIPNY